VIVSAPNWSGEYLPHGAAGMPASHPQQFVYARPRYLGKRRGFSGLGQSAPSPVWTWTCNPGTVSACSALDWLFGTSAACAAGLNDCFYGANAVGASAGLTLTDAPSAGPISTPEILAQSANPTGSNVAPDTAAALIAQQAATAAANACPAGYVAQSDGTCAPPSVPFSMPWWGWALIAGGVVLAVRK
jgi:hypothetical protein